MAAGAKLLFIYTFIKTLSPYNLIKNLGKTSIQRKITK